MLRITAKPVSTDTENHSYERITKKSRKTKVAGEENEFYLQRQDSRHYRSHLPDITKAKRKLCNTFKV